MKLNKNQKSILKQILSGKIFDLYSYIKCFDLGEYISYDKEEIFKLFTQDNICKEYYYPSNLKPLPANVLPADIFHQKVSAKEIDENKYTYSPLSLNFCTGIKEVPIINKTYRINFYNGVYVAKSFETIIEFLSLWQYLKSEMLVIEVPVEITPETIGLFFEKNISFSDAHISTSSIQLKDIDYTTFTYSDAHYLKKDMYSFSDKHYIICKEFLSKRIYPTPQLKLYIQNKFRTTEEITQQSALLAAWLAIFVSIFLTFIPYIRSLFDTNISQNTLNNMVIEDNGNSVPDTSVPSNSIIDQIE